MSGSGSALVLTPQQTSHDYYNMWLLLIIVIYDVYYLSIATDYSLIGTSDLAQDQHVQYHFRIFFAVFLTYIAVDTVWILIQPKCVLSNPTTLIYHHIGAAAFLIIPYSIKQFQWHFALNLIVESNTLFLVLKRHTTANSLINKLSNVMFYATWVLFRLVFYPIISVFMVYEYYRYTKEVGTWQNLMLLAPILQIILTLMGCMWTYELLSKSFRTKKKAV